MLGAIHFKDGILWAGWADLWLSNDTGKTWFQSSINLAGGIITDINFYDKLNGLVSTAEQGVFLTRDGGLNWKRILAAQHCTNIAFNGSPNIIHAITAGDVPSPTGLLHTSIDGGTTWTASWPGGDFSECFTVAKDKTIYVLCSHDNTLGLPGFVSSSRDLGNTWQQSSTEVDGDSYTICSDSCFSQNLYVANEDYTASPNIPNGLSDLYYSTNAGKVWTSAVSFLAPYLTGAMTCTTNTIYASSLVRGLYRSTDQGVTWKNIGGPPSMAFDSRNITCINDNIVFALDDQGSIWETTNSGGDSLSIVRINDLILSQNSLFTTDSLIVCDTSVSGFFYLQPMGCVPPTVTMIEIRGSDSMSYTTIPIAGDSIGVQFLPIFDSLNNSQLVLTLSDGRQKTLTLSGYGIPRKPLSLSTQDQTSDTLGGSVIVPIALNGLKNPENITLIIHYDTVLNYNGSFASLPSGSKLDIPNEQWKGRSKLKITGATSNATLGYALFDVFNDSVPIQHVTFDSVTVLSAISGCQYISPDIATSTITPLSGCGVSTISKLLHYGKMPELLIIPNPAGGETSITSSMDLGEINAEVYNMLGTLISSAILVLDQNTPAKLLLPVSNGVYEIRVKAVSGIYDLRVVVNK